MSKIRYFRIRKTTCYDGTELYFIVSKRDDARSWDSYSSEFQERYMAEQYLKKGIENRSLLEDLFDGPDVEWKILSDI